MSCTVVIPIYKTSLTALEREVLDQCHRVLARHRIVYVTPHGLDITSLGDNLEQKTFDSSYFASIDGYNKLMLSREFYATFADSDYILIYQTDAWVFNDTLDHWCSLGYDYIGAPWLGKENQLNKSYKTVLHIRRKWANATGLGISALKKWNVGNGGLSLRNPRRFLEVMGTINHDATKTPGWIHKEYNEDVIWALFLRRHLRIPSWDEAIRFAIESQPQWALKQLGGTLPFGCHGWNKNANDAFWQSLIHNPQQILGSTAKMQPLISIVVASYNYERFITMTLDSLLAQTYDNFEIIVVDDGSNDNSVDVVKRYMATDNRIKLYTHPDGANRGLVETLRLGISKCKGQYIAFCESDDLWTHNHLETIIDELNKHPEARIISNGVLTFGNTDKIKWLRKYFRLLHKNLHNGLNIINVRGNLGMNWIPTFSCVMIEAEVLRNINYDVPVPKWADIWIYQQVLCRYPLLHICHPLTLWRFHSNSQNTQTRDPRAKIFFSQLRQLTDKTFTDSPNSLYLSQHPIKRFWYKVKGII